MSKYKIITVLLFLLFVFAKSSRAVQTEGFISLEDYYSKDSTSSNDRHFFTTRVRLDLNKLNKAGTAGFHFDGRVRNELSASYSGTDKDIRVDILNFDYAGKSLYLSMGRLLPKEMGIETVDGVNLVYQKNRFGAGVFAGLRPNPYTDSSSSDFTSEGVYGFYNNESLSSSVAFVHNGYKGGTDRQYIYGQAMYSPWTRLLMFGTLTVDINPLTGDIQLTNGIGEVTYRPDDSKSFTVGYNQFRAFQYYKSTLFTDIENSRQDAYYLSANYRFKEKYMVYGRVEKQKRYFPSIEEDFRHMTSFRAGITGDNLLDTGVSMNASASVTDSFGSKYNAYNMEFSRLNWEILQVVVNAAYTQNLYGATSGGNIWSYGASGYLFIKRKWNVSLSYDREEGQDYVTDRLLSRVTFKF